VQIGDSRKNNFLALECVSQWLGHDKDSLTPYYVELIQNTHFLHEISIQMDKVSNFKSQPPGLFDRIPITNPDWFGLQRIFLYCFVRLTKPNLVVETGVYYGGNSSFVLEALELNKHGRLIGVDLPHHSMSNHQRANRHPWVGESELYSSKNQPGMIIPDYLNSRFKIQIGDSVDEINKIEEKVDFFIHDSEHTYRHVENELSAAKELRRFDGMILVDDVDWSNAFYDFVVRNNLYPYFLPDNGKDNLRIRTGLVKLNHKYNNLSKVTIR